MYQNNRRDAADSARDAEIRQIVAQQAAQNAPHNEQAARDAEIRQIMAQQATQNAPHNEQAARDAEIRQIMAQQATQNAPHNEQAARDAEIRQIMAQQAALQNNMPQQDRRDAEIQQILAQQAALQNNIPQHDLRDAEIQQILDQQEQEARDNEMRQMIANARAQFAGGQPAGIIQMPSDVARQGLLDVQTTMRNIVKKPVNLTSITIPNMPVRDYYSFKRAVHECLRQNGINEASPQMSHLKDILLLLRAELTGLYCCGCPCQLCQIRPRPCTVPGENLIHLIWNGGGAHVHDLTAGFTIEHMNRIGKAMAANQPGIMNTDGRTYAAPNWDNLPDILVDTTLARARMNCGRCMSVKTKHCVDTTALFFMRRDRFDQFMHQFAEVSKFMKKDAINLYMETNNLGLLEDHNSIDFHGIWIDQDFRELLMTTIYAIRVTPGNGILTDSFLMQRGA